MQKIVIGRIVKRSATTDTCCFRVCGDMDDLVTVKKLVTKTLSKSGYDIEIEGVD
jgi:hypothetical protein